MSKFSESRREVGAVARLRKGISLMVGRGKRRGLGWPSVHGTEKYDGAIRPIAQAYKPAGQVDLVTAVRQKLVKMSHPAPAGTPPSTRWRRRKAWRRSGIGCEYLPDRFPGVMHL